MRFIFLTLAFIVNTVSIAYTKSIKEIQFGFSYNTLKSSLYVGINPKETILYRHFNLRPSIRLSNTFFLKNNYQSKLSLYTFIGYNNFGGKFNSDNSKFKEIYSHHSIEMGFSPSLKILKNTIISFGIKANYFPFTFYKQYGTNNQSDTLPRQWILKNVSNKYLKFSSNLGLNIKYQRKKISFSFESWFGLTPLGNMNTINFRADIIENNYRLLLGYTISQKNKNNKERQSFSFL